MPIKTKTKKYKYKLKIRKFTILTTIIMFIMLSVIVKAETQTIRDVEIKIIIQEIEPNTEYTRIFRAENLDHVSGTTDLLYFTINAQLKKNNTLIKEWNNTRNINKYTETGMGSINLNTGKYELCTELTPQNFYDYNLTNNKKCTNITTTDYEPEPSMNNSTQEQEDLENSSENNEGNLNNDDLSNDGIVDENEENNDTNNDYNIIDDNFSDDDLLNDDSINNNDSVDVDNNNINESNEYNNENGIELNEQEENICDCKIEIITEKNIYENGQTITFMMKDCWNTTQYKYSLEYWVEDLFEEITKTKLTTLTKTPKSYTPKIQEREKTFLISTSIPGCEEKHQKAVTIKNTETEQRTTAINLEINEEAFAGEIINLELKGYKAETSKTLINIQLEQQGKKQGNALKLYVHKTNSEFELKIPYKLPENLKEGAHEYEITAKGLDQEIKKTIKITTPEKITQHEQKIKNVYTRKQKFEENINIIINLQTNQESIIKITTQKEIQEITTNKTINTIPIKISKPNETIIVELIVNNETKDIKLLKLNLEHNLKLNTINEELNESEKNIQLLQNNKETQTPEENKTEKNEQITQQRKQELLTEKPTTEKKNTNQITAKTINTITQYKKQTIFVILAITSILFLFRKELLIFKQKKQKN